MWLRDLHTSGSFTLGFPGGLNSGLTGQRTRGPQTGDMIPFSSLETCQREEKKKERKKQAYFF